MVEAIHGTAPRRIEDGLQDYVNPLSIFKAAEMMLRHIGRVDKAEKLKVALDRTQDPDAPKVTGFRDGATTAELLDFVFGMI